jgi:hypothetical protein
VIRPGKKVITLQVLHNLLVPRKRRGSASIKPRVPADKDILNSIPRIVWGGSRDGTITTAFPGTCVQERKKKKKAQTAPWW